MDSRAKLLGHPIHQMLIVFPLGLLSSAIIFDILQLVRGGDWSRPAWYMMTAGIVSGLLAAIFGLIDWVAIPSGTRAKAVGAWHGAGNVVVLLLFAASWYLRKHGIAHPNDAAYALSFGGFALSGVTAWLGGELVDRLGVGVHDGANLNAPSSIRTSSAQPDSTRVRA
jgi:uncharacterized membrane protein